MKTLQQQADESKNLDELVNVLNSFESDDRDGQDRIDHHIDLCNLPFFGREPADTMEIFSWDDTRVLTQNTCAGDDWELQERTEEFGA